MPINESQGERVAEAVEALEKQQADLQDAYDSGEVSKPEYERQCTRIAFQLDQLRREGGPALDQDMEMTQ